MKARTEGNVRFDEGLDLLEMKKANMMRLKARQTVPINLKTALLKIIHNIHFKAIK